MAFLEFWIIGQHAFEKMLVLRQESSIVIASAAVQAAHAQQP
jgi:hypothetical protein